MQIISLLRFIVSSVFVVKRDAIPHDTALTLVELFSVNITRSRDQTAVSKFTVNKMLLSILINTKKLIEKN